MVKPLQVKLQLRSAKPWAEETLKIPVVVEGNQGLIIYLGCA